MKIPEVGNRLKVIATCLEKQNTRILYGCTVVVFFLLNYLIGAGESLANTLYGFFNRGFARDLKAEISGDLIHRGRIERHAAAINGGDQLLGPGYFTNHDGFGRKQVFQPGDKFVVFA